LRRRTTRIEDNYEEEQQQEKENDEDKDEDEDEEVEGSLYLRPIGARRRRRRREGVFVKDLAEVAGRCRSRYELTRRKFRV